jgi:hypothetical protein
MWDMSESYTVDFKMVNSHFNLDLYVHPLISFA